MTSRKLPNLLMPRDTSRPPGAELLANIPMTDRLPVLAVVLFVVVLLLVPIALRPWWRQTEPVGQFCGSMALSPGIVYFDIDRMPPPRVASSGDDPK